MARGRLVEVDDTTSPFTERCMSASSSRSSMSSTMNSGWLAVTDWAMFCRRTVLPVRGGATIRARCPLPIGETISMTREE